MDFLLEEGHASPIIEMFPVSCMQTFVNLPTKQVARTGIRIVINNVRV